MPLLMKQFAPSCFYFPLVYPYMLFGNFSSDTLNIYLCGFLKVGNEVSYKTRGKIVVSNVLIFMFLVWDGKANFSLLNYNNHLTLLISS